jgi:hypothetical protein
MGAPGLGSPRVSVLVFGGYGVFGSLVCRELAQRGASVTVAGRDLGRASRLAEALGRGHSACAADARDASSVRAALAGHAVAVHCAGPFSKGDHGVVDACLETGCHYVDIADDRGYAAFVRAQTARFRARGTTAVVGSSSLPGLSGALAVIARESRPDAPSRVRLTLFIGNDNTKSAAAVHSVVSSLGRAIEAPPAAPHVFREHESVLLPAPFGRRTAHVVDSPEYDLLPSALGVRDVRVLVGFENVLAGPLFAGLARLGWRGGRRAASALATLGGFVRAGSSGGSVVADVFWADGTTRREGLHARRDGQRLAAVPAALVARALEDAPSLPRGAFTAYDLLGAEALVAATERAGFERLRA